MAKNELFLGADVGTTGCRTCLVSADGQLVAAAATPYEPERPQPGWAEQDARVWWEAFCESVCKLGRQADLNRVAALSVSGQSTALLPLGPDGEPLRKAIIWQDNRSAPQCEEVAARFGHELVRAVTGMRPSTFLVWPKMLWFMRNEPDLFQRSRTFAAANGYVVWKLCGRMVLDRANAVGYPTDLETGTWWEQFCSSYDFPTCKIPPVVPSDSVAGAASGAGARAACLPEGVPVVAGGMDTACAALAIGAAREGRAFEVTGTSGGIGVVSSRPTPSPLLGVTPHLLQDLYINHAPMSAAGASLSWFRECFCAEEEMEARRRGVGVYDIMGEEAAAAPQGPTGLLFLPYLAGERAPVWDARARGVMLGFGLDTTRRDMIKAVMEGVGYALKQNVQVAREAGLVVSELRSCGGGSRNATWCQIKADILGIPVAVYADHRDAAFGAALLAGLAMGRWSLDELDRQLLGEQRTDYTPRPALTAQYAPHFERYCRLYPRLKDLF